MLFDQNVHVVISIFWHFTNSFHGNQLFCNIRNTFVVPAHQTSDMSRFTISPESRLKLEMVILSNLRNLTILTFQYVNCQFMCPDYNKHELKAPFNAIRKELH